MYMLLTKIQGIIFSELESLFLQFAEKDVWDAWNTAKREAFQFISQSH